MKPMFGVSLKCMIFPLFALSLPNTVYASQTCFTTGYIKSVYTNLADFNYKGVIGIRVQHDDGQTRYYNTHGFHALDDAVVRSLLQQATTALVAQSRVRVGVVDICTNTHTLNKQVWVRGWNGLTLE